MEAPLLKRHLNPFLLVSVVLTLSLLAGLSVLYQGQLSNVLTQKKDLKQELDTTKKRLSSVQQQNANLTHKLTIKQQDLSSTISELNQKRSLIQDLNSTVDNLESNLELTRKRLNKTKSRAEKLNSSVEELCSVPSYNLTSDGKRWCEHWNFTG